MNIHRAALVAPILLLCASARAVDLKPALTAAEAEAAVETAASRAESNAKQLASVPAEFARALFAARYADETGVSADVSNPGAKDIKARLDAKAAYWASVSAALKAENERLSDEIDEMSRNAHNGVEDAMMRSMKLSRVRAAAELISADVAADAASLADPSKESGRAIIDRKAELCRRLAQMKPARG